MVKIGKNFLFATIFNEGPFGYGYAIGNEAEVEVGAKQRENEMKRKMFTAQSVFFPHGNHFHCFQRGKFAQNFSIRHFRANLLCFCEKYAKSQNFFAHIFLIWHCIIMRKFLVFNKNFENSN